jgi:hypothetical protein
MEFDEIVAERVGEQWLSLQSGCERLSRRSSLQLPHRVTSSTSRGSAIRLATTPPTHRSRSYSERQRSASYPDTAECAAAHRRALVDRSL